MGTSINQHSPRIPNWNRVIACYKDENIPEFNVINQIWRASEAQDNPISDEIKSEIIFHCYKIVERSSNYKEAYRNFNDYILERSKNSIIAEFAKRSIAPSYNSPSPSSEWKSCFFSELTLYFISRDIPGFINKNYKNKSVTDLINYKERVRNRVKQLTISDEPEIKTSKDWNKYVDSIVNKLKNYNE